MEVLTYLAAAAAILALVIVSYRLLGAWSRRRVARSLNDPDEILTAVRIYESYQQRRAAIELLESGLERHPGHPALSARLAELRADGNGA